MKETDNEKLPLHEPLLRGDNDHQSELDLSRFKIVAFLSGSLIAVASQLVLGEMLWQDDILQQSTAHILVFSLHWSFWTCLVIFGAMFLLIQAMQSNPALHALTADDNHLFQLEAHHVIGSLTAISLTWLLNDVWHVNTSNNKLSTGMLIAVCLLLYALFCGWMVSSSCGRQGDASLLQTLVVMSSLLGLVVGACSQFFLAAILWDEPMQQPLIGNVVVFSLVWSLLTVLMTAAGCASLRALIDHDEKESSQRAILRMEAAYVSCTLLGICTSWILMDVCLDMLDQIGPSLGLLAVSMALFRLVLYCFPEDECVVREQEMIPVVVV